MYHLNYNLFSIEELDSVTTKKDAASLKAYLTQGKVNERAAYARYETTGLSELSFIASVNTSSFLIDETGNRRFAVIAIKECHLFNDIDVQQVFAEAYSFYQDRFQYWLSDEDMKVLEKSNASFEGQDSISAIADNLEPGTHIKTLKEIFYDHGVMKYGRAEQSRLSTFISRMGIVKEVEWVNNRKLTKYLVNYRTGTFGIKL